jgi:hypothetical protein
MGKWNIIQGAVQHLSKRCLEIEIKGIESQLWLRMLELKANGQI